MLKKGDKGGLSPVIATVLLVGLVVVSGLIIFVWFRGLTQEAVTKFDRNIQLVCKDVKFDASYDGTDLDLVNRASTPIYGFNVKKIFADGGYETIDIREEDDWPDNGLLGSGAITLGIDLGSVTDVDVTLTPVLAGTTQNGEQTSFACDENLYGQPVSI